MSTPNDRQKIIDTWHDLNETMGDWERGRVDEQAMRDDWKDYVAACNAINEPAFWLKDIASAEHIPAGYPESGPTDLPQRRGIYLTPKYEAFANARSARLRLSQKKGRP